MALRLANTVPGALPDVFAPGSPVLLGLKDTTGSVRLGSLIVSAGASSIGYDSALPELSSKLSRLEADVSLVTTEHRQPATTSIARSIVGGNLRFSKTNNDDFEKCLYEVKFPVQPVASMLGYVKFKTNTAWTLFSPDWCNLTSMAGPYFSFEHGSFNTALFAFLRDNGAGGSLVLGGPMQSFASARPGQVEVGLNWLSLPNGTEVELWFFYNVNGYPSPFVPANIPIIEVWARRAGVDTSPVLLTTVSVASLGTFPKNTFPNFRNGQSNNALLTFGLAGKNGDVLEVADWGLFPDYRLSVHNGVSLPSTDLFVLPDGFLRYKASDSLLPTEVSPGPWFPALFAPYVRPDASLFYPPGRKTVPYALNVQRKSINVGAFTREEPRLETGVTGAVIEALMYGTQTTRVNDTFGSGISIDDGTNIFRVLLLETDTYRTIGISKGNFDFSLAGYYLPSSPIDWSTPKLIRLSVDKTRGKVSLVVDGELVLEVSTAGTFPPSDGHGGRVMFGDLAPVDSRGFTRFVEVNYGPRFQSWEYTDQTLPTAAPYSWTQVGPANGAAASTIWWNGAPPNATSLVIDKEDPLKNGSAIYYSKAEDFADTKGFFVDFETEFAYYADSSGHGFGSETAIETGLTIFLGNKVLKLRFFECGIFGKFIGIVPGSGTVQDIVKQTALGQRFSASLDWIKKTKYRLEYLPYHYIRVWAVTTLQEPLIDIPWRNIQEGFDLPVSVATPAIQFGHFSDETVSEVRWTYLRYGISNGYEISVKHKYDGELPPYLFNGPLFVRSEFDE